MHAMVIWKEDQQMYQSVMVQGRKVGWPIGLMTVHSAW